MAQEERDASRRAFIAELGKRLPSDEATEEEPGRDGRTRVISISMDVCGSTDVKARMRQRAQDDKDLNRWYADFQRQFLNAEWRFYESLFRESDREIGWNWKRAFVVKGIGDEIWLLYEVWENTPAMADRNTTWYPVSRGREYRVALNQLRKR